VCLVGFIIRKGTGSLGRNDVYCSGMMCVCVCVRARARARPPTKFHESLLVSSEGTGGREGDRHEYMGCMVVYNAFNFPSKIRTLCRNYV
jgi:hypothetical protein